MAKRPVLIFGILVPLITVIIDQATKYGIIKMFEAPLNICEIDPNPGLFREVSSFMDFSLVCNQGISWGLLQGDSPVKRWLLTAFAFAMCIALFYTLVKTKDKWTQFSLGLVIGGAIGNGIDRALFGAVTDFINVTDILPFFHWIFNVADSAITIGVIGLILASFFGKPDADAKPEPN